MAGRVVDRVARADDDTLMREELGLFGVQALDEFLSQRLLRQPGVGVHELTDAFLDVGLGELAGNVGLGHAYFIPNLYLSRVGVPYARPGDLRLLARQPLHVPRIAREPENVKRRLWGLVVFWQASPHVPSRL